jgi:cytochrome c oxidase assembly factor CtaG
LKALSHLLIVLLSIGLIVFTLVSMWKENRFGWPLKGIIWFTVAIIGSCAIIGLLAGYDQTARSLGHISQRVEMVTFPDGDGLTVCASGQYLARRLVAAFRP